jgi:large subunit ribosomal protein L1
MGSKKNVAVSGVDEVKIVAAPTIETEDKTNDNEDVDAENTAEATPVEATPTKKTRIRSKKYTSAKSKIDKSKKYELTEAIEIVKKLSYSKFDGTIEAHLVVKEAGISTSLSFPHSTGKSIKAVIFSDKVIKDIEAGKIDFDVLLATPQDMPKLTKFARVLGPKGLMPNPKNGTLSTNPEAKKKELEAGKFTLKAERKAPLVHIGVGKVSMKTEELAANVQALLDSLIGKVEKLALSATMSPSVKVVVEN